MDYTKLALAAAGEKDEAFKKALLDQLTSLTAQVQALRAEVAELKAPRKSKE